MRGRKKETRRRPRISAVVACSIIHSPPPPSAAIAALPSRPPPTRHHRIREPRRGMPTPSKAISKSSHSYKSPRQQLIMVFCIDRRRKAAGVMRIQLVRNGLLFLPCFRAGRAQQRLLLLWVLINLCVDSILLPLPFHLLPSAWLSRLAAAHADTPPLPLSSVSPCYADFVCFCICSLLLYTRGRLISHALCVVCICTLRIFLWRRTRFRFREPRAAVPQALPVCSLTLTPAT